MHAQCTSLLGDFRQLGASGFLRYIRAEGMCGGEYSLVGQEADEGLAVSLREMDSQKNHRVVEKEARRNGCHVRRGFVAEEDRVVSAVDFGGDGGAVGGVAPEDGTIVVD